MKISKKSVGNLAVCYSVAPVIYKGEPHFVVGSEQDHPSVLFDQDGNQAAVLWETPGGNMSTVQIPGKDGAFLAIRGFYSPDRGKDAALYLVWEEEGVWKNRIVAPFPCLHRFDILTRGGASWVIACTLKDGYEYDGDWRFPGKVWAARLPENLLDGPEIMLPEFTVLQEGMLENHGYSRDVSDGIMSGIVSCREGTYQFIPPEEGEEWTVRKLCDDPASDAVLIDLDGCGEKELITIMPFHGDTIAIYKPMEGKYRKVWEYEKKVPLAHGIIAGVICHTPMAVIGHRINERDLFSITYDNGYKVTVIDHNVGPTNVMHFKPRGKDVIVAANREINEVGYYTFEEE